MYLVQFLLPLYDNNGSPIPRPAFEEVRSELTERFGGVTAYLRSPAQGFWKESDDEVVKDDLVLFEVLAEEVDREWWSDYKRKLLERFRQEEIIVRASEVESL
jgi:hypothetical protein